MCRFCALVGSGTVAVVINLQMPVGECRLPQPWQQAGGRPREAKGVEQRAATQQTSFTCCGTELLREAGSRRVLVDPVL